MTPGGAVERIKKIDKIRPINPNLNPTDLFLNINLYTEAKRTFEPLAMQHKQVEKKVEKNEICRKMFVSLDKR